MPCSGFSQFPTISASPFQIGSQWLFFWFVASGVTGCLPSIPASLSQWKNRTPGFKTQVAAATLHPRKAPGLCSAKLIQGHCSRGTQWRGQASQAHHDPPGGWQQHTLNFKALGLNLSHSAIFQPFVCQTASQLKLKHVFGQDFQGW